MSEHHEREAGAERVYLVGIRYQRSMTRAECEEHLDELERLCRTLDVEIVGREMVTLHSAQSALLVGSGKADEICANAEMAEAQMIVFDDDLSASQQRNWEKLSKKTVIDRREVILEIFNERAHTREARLQVDLARHEYELPRLKRAWTHLERQRGGAGFVGGAGEAQIEVDRRLIRDNIAKLKKELETVRRQRATQRKARRGVPVPTVALVGYTNSGKSTLLNRLTQAGVLAEDKLFATLDPTTRRLQLPNGFTILLTDTVGFIRKLPHSLVDAFKATLEEAQLSDLLLHVVDASHPAAADQAQTTAEVLKELGADTIPCIYVLNKSDAVKDPLALAGLASNLQPNVVISAATGDGIEMLARRLEEFSETGMKRLRLRIPPANSGVVSLLHEDGIVHAETYDDEDTLLVASVPVRHLARVEPYIIDPAQTHEPSEAAT